MSKICTTIKSMISVTELLNYESIQILSQYKASNVSVRPLALLALKAPACPYGIAD